jgi:regulator of replication initiation timing
MWKFRSAGRIISFRQIFLFLILFFFVACGNNKAQQPDPQIDQLKNDVRKLSEDNQRLQRELEELRSQINQPAPSPAEIQPQTIHQMSLEEMKKEVAPILKETIDKIKKANETPKNGDQYGMRMEYDFNHAVYGLAQTEDEAAPYSAKVIVKFEKFLESNQSSKSYGNGSNTFLFSYRNGQWVLDSYQ